MVLVIFRCFLNFGPFFGPFLGLITELASYSIKCLLVFHYSRVKLGRLPRGEPRRHRPSAFAKVLGHRPEWVQGIITLREAVI